MGARIDLDVPGWDDAPLDEELVAPRAGEDVLEGLDLLPGIVQGGTEADNGTGIIPLVIGRLNAGEVPSDGKFDLFIA